MSMEMNGNAHGVLLLNSNAMGMYLSCALLFDVLSSFQNFAIQGLKIFASHKLWQWAGGFQSHVTMRKIVLLEQNLPVMGCYEKICILETSPLRKIHDLLICSLKVLLLLLKTLISCLRPKQFLIRNMPLVRRSFGFVL